MPIFRYVCLNCGKIQTEIRDIEWKDLGAFCRECGDIALLEHKYAGSKPLGTAKIPITE